MVENADKHLNYDYQLLVNGENMLLDLTYLLSGLSIFFDRFKITTKKVAALSLFFVFSFLTISAIKADYDMPLNIENLTININQTVKSIYAQLSDLQDQTFAVIGRKEPINLTTTDESYGIEISISNITIQTTGVYDIASQPQVTAGPGDAGNFHMWIEKHNTTEWITISNSNVELTLDSNDEDVIPLLIIIKLKAGEKIRIMGSVSNTGIFLDAKTPVGEPIIPSIILRIFKTGD